MRTNRTCIATHVSRAWPQRATGLRGSCSWLVLAGLGLLGPAPSSLAQTTPSAGTLPVLRGVVSGQAVVNRSAPGAIRSELVVNQASERAIIDWRSFNVSREGQVLFIQPSSTASTLNRIYDADPSVIQGKVSSTGPVVNGQATAGGQIILINQNGILFDRGMQVNAQSLVASTLNLSNARFLSGALTSGGLTSAAFEGGYDDAGNTLAARPDGSRPGSIGVGSFGPAADGAPRITANAGGSVVLVATRIDNESGVITAPDGQVILAAGSKVYLALNEDDANTTLRGFRVEVQAAADGPALNLTNLVRNAGTLSADRGNVTLAALSVNQEGRISAKTAVQANGSIYLKARTVDNQAGTVTLAAGSTTEVLPDAADKSTMPDSADYSARRGTIEVDGRSITSGGTMTAAGGRIVLRAADDTDPGAARIYLGSGSQTSVAGDWADVPYANNLASFRVTSNELKNAPDQKTGVLRGAQVTVDLRRTSSILDLSGYIGSQPRTVAEKAATGGELRITSTGSVVQRQGATLDASGGGYRYSEGSANTSRLLGADGKVYDIATAPQTQTYTALLDSFTPKDPFNQLVSYDTPLGRAGATEAGYSQGLAGGSVLISAPGGLVLDGAFKGGVTIGPRQMAQAPRGATLTLGQFDASLPSDQQPLLIGAVTFARQARDTLGAGFTAATPLSSSSASGLSLAADSVFGASRITDQGLVETGFGAVLLNAGGPVTVPADVQLESPTGSSLTLRTAQLDVYGSLHLPGGQITVPAASAAPLNVPLLADPVTRVTLHSGAALSTAGTWINTALPDGSYLGTPTPTARLNASGSTTLTTAGGDISLTAQSLLVQRGTLLDVSGGASMDRSGRITGGAGGSLSLANGLSTASSSDWLQGELRGFGLTAGGQLTLTTPRIVLQAAGANGTLPSDTTRFGPGLFSDNGFATVRLNAPLGLSLDAGTTIAPRQRNLLLDADVAAGLATGASLYDHAQLLSLPDQSRGPVNVSLSANDTVGTRGTITLGAASVLSADPKARITASASNGLTAAGSILAPGGDVTLSLTAPVDGAPPLQLTRSALISTAGTFVQNVSDRGLVQGSVLAGGTVTLDARNAGMQLDAGSRIDVSGTHQVVDVAGTGAGAPTVATPLDGPAGSVLIKSQGSLALNGSLTGRAPAATAAGGSFALELVAPDLATSARPDTRRVVVTAGTTTAASEAGIVDAVLSTNALAAGGFDKLRLLAEDRIEFRGDDTLSFARGVRLDAPLLDVTGNAHVLIQGANVQLGQSLSPRLRNGDGSFSLAPLATSPVLGTRAGDGTLRVLADSLDMYGNLTVNGISQAVLEAAHDIRLIGRPSQAVLASGANAPVAQAGSLTTEGNVTLKSAQVYPATRTSYTISVEDTVTNTPVPGGYVLIASNGSAAGDVYSAGGKLSIQADTIVQGGRLAAPMGEIDLQAGRLLELSAGSTTSVSAGGLTVPFGTTSAGVNWTYTDGATPVNSVTQINAQGKRIGLRATSVDVQSGATVDLSGGGDVRAIEFVPGNGGDRDITVADNTYAIIPKSHLASKPFDADIVALKDIGFGFGSARQDTAIYDSLRIGAGGAVPAGDYVLLPARYALLPDAYLVQVQTGAGYSNLKLGQTVGLANGNTVMAAFRSASGTAVTESQSVGVVVRPGTVAVRQASDYTLTGSQFFADAAARERIQAPPLPRDAGRLTVTQATQLNLAGSFATGAGAGADGNVGQEAQFDISGPRIAIVDQLGSTAVGSDYLQLSALSLSSLGGSVLLGGVRTDTSEGVRITTEADRIVVANSLQTELRLPELLLSARDTIDIRAGAALAGTGTGSGTAPKKIQADSSGALVRLSNTGQTTVDRGSSVDSSAGQVLIASGARLRGDRAVLVDATRSTQSAGELRAGGVGGAGGSLSLSAAQLSLGEVAGVSGLNTGLVLSNSDLANYASLTSLTLRGYGGIDLYGSTQLGGDALQQLTLDTASLRGHGAGTSSIGAQSIQFSNAGKLSGSTAASTAGNLNISAQTLIFGAGDKTVTGWNQVTTSARGEIIGAGTGSLAVAADWQLLATRLRGDAGANQTWAARDAASAYRPMRIDTAPDAATLATDNALGARLNLEAQRMALNTTVQALSGRLTLAAKGTAVGDDLAVGAQGRILAGGASKDFNGTVALADAGAVSLSADMGNGQVTLAAGSVVDVSAGSAGGHAGSLQVAAAGWRSAGELRGSANAGSRSGSVALDLGALAAESDFSVLNSSLNSGGFAEARSLRLRNGNLVVAAGDLVTARDVILAADAGQMTVQGTVGTGASQGRGASVGLYAGTGLSLADGSVINAAGSSVDAINADAGDVRIATRTGALNFASGATIDVRRGALGEAGSVTFTLPRSSSNALGANDLQGTVLSQGGGTQEAVTVVVEGQRNYTASGSVSAAQITGWAADHQAFINNSNASALLGRLKADGGTPALAVLRGATEVTSSSDLSVAQAWDLMSSAWMAGARPGTLRLRAAGNLTLSNSLGSPNDNILAGETWSIGAVAGADLTAAQPLAWLSGQALAVGKGDLLLTGANVRVRTGTGRIDLAAARDIRIDNVRAAVYTAGRIGAADTETGGNNRWGVRGGDLTLSAGRDVLGASSAAGDLWITDWLRRPRLQSAVFATLQQTDWWAYRPNFQQAVGALAGGNIDIMAGRDVSNLSAMLPTTGRTYLDGTGLRQVDVQGGGDLRLLAGSNVVGGAYLVGRGEGRLDAAGDIGRDRNVQLYMMGFSSGNLPAQSNFDVTAGGSLRVQSISNPTVLAQFNVTGATGPSFGNSGLLSSFFTYTDNNLASLRADSGTLSLDSSVARPARVLGTTPITDAQTASLPGAFPASITAVAFDGSIVDPTPGGAAWVSFPSASAQVRLLAEDSIPLLSMKGSDRDPTTLSTPTSVQFTGASSTLRSLVTPLSGDSLLASGSQARITQRAVDTSFIFDIQALRGSITGANEAGQQSALSLPARSRVRAGLDIVGVDLVLQNLAAGDLSEVRADIGDIRAPRALEIRGPGRLLLQAGRNVDLGSAQVILGSANAGGLVATGNNANARLTTTDSARITVVAGVTGTVDLGKLDAAYKELIALNSTSGLAQEFYAQLTAETRAEAVLAAATVADLAKLDRSYERFVSLDSSAPRLLSAFQSALRAAQLPLLAGADSAAAKALYRLLNADTDTSAILSAGSVAALAAKADGAAFQAYVDLDRRFPRVFKDYVQRRSKGGLPATITSIVFSDALDSVIREVIPSSAVAAGGISSFNTSIQTYGGSDIDLLAPSGNIVIGLTTPSAGATIGVLTNSGGAVRSLVSGNFDINQGKLLTAQGGDILILSTQGSIDAGRGAKTSLSTPPPVRTPVFGTDADGNQVVIGFLFTIPASASGSGIQTLTSDPDGNGPRTAPAAGNVYLFAPAGTIDAGEAGIRSSGNIVINGQTVLNASNISSSGTATGVPQVQVGSLSSALATSGAAANTTSKSGEESAASEAARKAAAAPPAPKPTILSVEVLGFGDKNCKEDDKDCFAK